MTPTILILSIINNKTMHISTKKNNHFYFSTNHNSWLLLSPSLLSTLAYDHKKRIGSDDHQRLQDHSFYLRKLKFLEESGTVKYSDDKENLITKISKEEIEHNIANVRNVIFETTENCNLQCKYCAYGEFYEEENHRERKTINNQDALALLKYLTKYWDSPLNESYDKDISISFYGGEPLLNVQFIEEIISYCRSLKSKNYHFIFRMTTNGVLLNHHINFLIQNNFRVLVSLDGYEKNNSYRVLKNNKNSFSLIFKNLKEIKENHPDFFKNNIEFNSVLHNRNSVKEITDFFFKEFDKIPNISHLNTSGIKESKRKDFWNTYSNYSDYLQNTEDYSGIEKKLFIKSPIVQDTSFFIHSHIGFNAVDYNDLFRENTGKRVVPTGTCRPFSRRLFLSAKGEILPCERINSEYAMGSVVNGKVNLASEDVAKNHSENLDKIKPLCEKCYFLQRCTQCLFYLNLNEKDIVCNGFLDKANYQIFLSQMISNIEEDTSTYFKIVDEVSLS
ncbi:MAG: radical SAM peptide maturase [Bacteroidales bacterium]|nr:MAG: radical SAM peptide maturase [Bacteroidales bacterium]